MSYNGRKSRPSVHIASMISSAASLVMSSLAASLKTSFNGTGCPVSICILLTISRIVLSRFLVFAFFPDCRVVSSKFSPINSCRQNLVKRIDLSASSIVATSESLTLAEA